MTDLARRYGTHSRARRRAGYVALAVLAAVLLGWGAWAGVVHSRPLTHSDLLRFDVTGAHRVVATVTVVRRDTDVRARCVLRASAADHAVVGEVGFTVEGDTSTTTTLTQQVRTERRASAVELVGCTADGQEQPR